MWQVLIHPKVEKKLTRLPKRIQLVATILYADLEDKGPNVGQQWPNYGKLRGKKTMDRRHCHLVKGNPTYVACWEVVDKIKKIIEIYYIGTHEKAPY